MTVDDARRHLARDLAELPVLRDAALAHLAYLDCADLRAFLATGPNLVGTLIYWVGADQIVSSAAPEPAARALLGRIHATGARLGPRACADLVLALAGRLDIVLDSRAVLDAIRAAVPANLAIEPPSSDGARYRFTTLDTNRDALVRWSVQLDADAFRVATEVIGHAPR